MSADPQLATPENNVVLRQLAAVRHDVAAMLDRQARIIELLGRVTGRIDDLTGRTDRGFAEVRSDIVMLENKLVSAQSDLLRLLRPIEGGEPER